MGDILLVVMIFIVFFFGYFVTYRFGRFMDKNFPTYHRPQTADRTVYITETEGKNAIAVSKEIGAMVDSLIDGENFGIIICKTADSRFIECLKRSGCSVEYQFRQ